MLSRLCAVVLLLTAAGCAAPPAGADDGGAPTAQSYPRLHPPMASQLAALPSEPLTPDLLPDSVLPSDLNNLTILPSPARPRPSIIRLSHPLQCVPYARRLSKIDLRGNAWTWWRQAKGRYQRGSTPQPGAVLVMSKTHRLNKGHLAYVVAVLSSREIVVHQANWLNSGNVHRYTPVRDISKNNDWSVVRVWYTPGHRYGARHYPTYGFIYPASPQPREVREAAN